MFPECSTGVPQVLDTFALQFAAEDAKSAAAKGGERRTSPSSEEPTNGNIR
jgi:hypothetical protein